MTVQAQQPGPEWRLAASALTLPGLVLGHVLAYRLAYPSPHERAVHLHETSHDAFSALVVGALAVLPLALALAAVAALRSPARTSIRRVAATMAALQVAAFLLVELLERGMAVGATAVDPAVLVGAALQAPLGAAIVYLLAAFGLGVGRIALCLAGPSSGAPLTHRSAIHPVAVAPIRSVDISDQVAQRAPPRSHLA